MSCGDIGNVPLVSIHAPVRGATIFHLHHIGKEEVSIHAPVRGATNTQFGLTGPALVSIHAPVRGATHFPRPECGNKSCFNPRTREGCDNAIQWVLLRLFPFQSTHP